MTEFLRNKSKKYQICIKCIMDTTDLEIFFDECGICNHCREYDERAKSGLYYDDLGQEKLKNIIKKIKKEGEGKKYDCVIGVSGGADSTYLLYMLKQFNIRPLAVHLDNGWNTELSIKNIELATGKLGIDLYTHVLDWEEFKDLQMSFLESSIANIEIPTDHAIVALIYKKAVEIGTKYIISGGNITTEAIMPDSWMYDAKDWKIIRSIQRKFGRKSLRTFPHLSLIDMINFSFVKKIKYIPFLNYFIYDKKKAVEIIEKQLGWRNYGSKHSESIYTRFFQNYILPRKFNIDKRLAHLSTLICSKQLTRDEALFLVGKGFYSDEKTENEEKQYVIKKLGISNEDFENIMSRPIRSFKDYPNNSWFFDKNNIFVKLAKKIITSI